MLRFVRRAFGADAAVAFEAGRDGLAQPLAADPGAMPQMFDLGLTAIDAIDWSDGPLDAARLAFPGAPVPSDGRPAGTAFLIRAPFAAGERSGVLLLWDAGSTWPGARAWHGDAEQDMAMLSAVFSQLLAAHRAGRTARQTLDRFHDLFETVPTGLVMVGEAGTGQLNARAGMLLGVAAGEVAATVLAERMLALRRRCSNHDALDRLYAGLQGDPNYAATAIWRLGPFSIEVETRPIRGQGSKGRIWILHDATARERLAQERRRQAETDPLTGLENRRRFSEVAGDFFRRDTAGAPVTALLVLDVDHFKSVNDRFGHQAGDTVLRAIADQCRRSLRESDLIGRLGGEEFGVILPDTEPGEARRIAERLRAVVAATPFDVAGRAIEITVSVGGATLGAGDASMEAWLNRADMALYAAKHAGRNRVVFA